MMLSIIVNENYATTPDGLLIPLPKWARINRPWRAMTGNKFKNFRTHADAIRWADKQARKGKV